MANKNNELPATYSDTLELLWTVWLLWQFKYVVVSKIQYGSSCLKLLFESSH